MHGADDQIVPPTHLLEAKEYLNKHGLRESQRLDKQLFTILSLEIWLRVFHEKYCSYHICLLF